jgi:hypothetical protein
VVVPAAPQNLIFIRGKDRGLGREREGGSLARAGNGGGLVNETVAQSGVRFN